MPAPRSKTRILLARLAVLLITVFIVLGIASYGLSTEVLGRIWRNMLDRPAGPMTFRFVLQPSMAGIAALYDGIKDAREGRSPYLWTVLTDPAKRIGRLGEGTIATARVVLLGLAMDTIYQHLVFDTFHPAEAAIISVLLAFLPYVLLRGPFSRLAVWWRRTGSTDEAR